MSQIRSQFVVEVLTPNVEQARAQLAAIEGLGKRAGSSGKGGMAEAAASLGKVSKSLDQLLRKFNALASSLRNVAASAGGANKAGRGAAPGAPGGGMPSGGEWPGLPPPGGSPAERHDRHRRHRNKTAPLTGGGPRPGNQPGDPLTRGDMSRHAFKFGFMQGLMPNAFGMIQRGPGALRQAMGQQAGSVLGGLGTMLVGGGLGAAAGAMGSLVSAPLGRYMGKADEAMAFQRQQMGLMPLLGGAGQFSLENALPESEVTSRATAYANKRADSVKTSVSRMHSNARSDSWRRKHDLLAQRDDVERAQARREAYAQETERLRGTRQATAMDKMGRMGAAGRELMGAGFGQTQAFMADIAGSGAGTAAMAGDQFIQTAMATRTALGVGAETTGAFALGSRTGAVAGREGQSNTQLLLEAISQTQDLGLTGSDAQDYLRQMAEGIRQFQATGMPLQMDSIAQITKGLTGFGGMTGLAAQTAARNMQASSAQFGERGPQSALDMLILRKAGFTGGITSLLKTERTIGMDSNKYAGAVMDALPELVAASGSNDEVAYKDMRDALKQTGISGDMRVAMRAVDDIRKNGTPGKDFRAGVAAAHSGRKELSFEELTAQARAMTPETMKEAARVSDQGIVIGSSAAAVSQELDAAANETAAAMSRFSGVLLKMAQVAHSVTGTASGGMLGSSSYSPTGG